MRRVHRAAALAGLIAGWLVLIAAIVPHTVRANDDSWGVDTRRTGLAFEYGFSFTTLHGGEVRDNFGLKSPGIGWMNLALGVQFDELLELRLHGYVEDDNNGGTATRDNYGILFGLRMHVVPGNTFNWRVPNMLDFYVEAMMGWSEITNHSGTGYINGLELRAGFGIRGSTDTRGTWDNPGIFWFASAAFRYVSYANVEINYTSFDTSDTLADVVCMFGIGFML